MYVLLYLSAIVGANLIVNKFGPSISVLTAFLFIGLDLTARDKLHDSWHNEQLRIKMAVLIISGSALTVVLNWGAWRIAVASCVAFASAAIVDTIIYQWLENRNRWLRVNGSNIPSAMIDSIVFPALAFGFPLLYDVMLGQFVAKVGGGLLWSFIIYGAMTRAKSLENNGEDESIEEDVRR